MANTIVFSCGQFACLQRGMEGRLLPSTDKAIPSIPRMFDHLVAPGYRRDRSDCSNLHVKGVLTTGRLILKATCPVKVEGGEGRGRGTMRKGRRKRDRNIHSVCVWRGGSVWCVCGMRSCCVGGVWGCVCVWGVCGVCGYECGVGVACTGATWGHVCIMWAAWVCVCGLCLWVRV